MPSDFVNGRPKRRKKTLPDLLRQLQADAPSPARAISTSPVAGPGRIREAQRATRNRESELERRQRAAHEALKRLKG